MVCLEVRAVMMNLLKLKLRDSAPQRYETQRQGNDGELEGTSWKLAR